MWVWNLSADARAAAGGGARVDTRAAKVAALGLSYDDLSAVRYPGRPNWARIC